MDKNVFEDYFNPDDYWFWLLLPITAPLWMLGWFVDVLVDLVSGPA